MKEAKLRVTITAEITEKAKRQIEQSGRQHENGRLTRVVSGVNIKSLIKRKQLGTVVGGVGGGVELLERSSVNSREPLLDPAQSQRCLCRLAESCIEEKSEISRKKRERDLLAYRKCRRSSDRERERGLPIPRA